MPAVKTKGTGGFLTRVDRTTLTGDVCRKLISHLVRGDWAEGDRIPSERELCELLGVGRASLREALKALEIMGMIEVRVGDGTFVCRRSEFLSRPLLWAVASSPMTDVHELIEARRVLEREMADFAAGRADAEDLAEMQNCIDSMEESADNHLAFMEADVNFHLAVARAARTEILFNAVQMLRNLMRQWISEAYNVRGVPVQALEEHKAILAAIAKKDGAAARLAMEEHLSHMGDALLRLKQSPSRTISRK